MQLWSIFLLKWDYCSISLCNLTFLDIMRDNMKVILRFFILFYAIKQKHISKKVLFSSKYHWDWPKSSLSSVCTDSTFTQSYLFPPLFLSSFFPTYFKCLGFYCGRCWGSSFLPRLRESSPGLSSRGRFIFIYVFSGSFFLFFFFFSQARRANLLLNL